MEREVIAVAMSGGADSAAALLRLSEAGHDVIGLTALLTGHAAEDAARAGELCAHLGVPHHTVDLTDAFARLVIEPFITEYARGRTPNPCVGCNEHIKFGLLAERAEELGAQRLATGHYARIGQDRGGPCLLRALSLHKDQSYVLHHLSGQQLDRVLFPNGESSRADVQRLVDALGVAFAPLPESQDICFLRGAGHTEFLRARAPGAFEPGEIVDTSGKALGTHAGLCGYTVGQRKGLGIGGPGGRLFVLHVDAEANRLVVGDEGEVWVSRCDVEDVRLIARAPSRGLADNPCGRGFQPRRDPQTSGDRGWKPLPQNEGAEGVLLGLTPGRGSEQFACDVMLRYNGPLTPAAVTVTGDKARIAFETPARAPAPGQSAVFYQGEFCLGGGVIAQTELTQRFGA